MLLTDVVAPSAIIPALKVNSKKQILQELAAKAAQLCGHNERTILEILQQREKLGSTGVGSGIAIPHGKLPKLSKLFGLFARLERPVDFEALDGQHNAVDLLAAREYERASSATSRLSTAVRTSRAPSPPETLVGALHGRVHQDLGPSRPARSVKVDRRR
jgi:PTS system nitrogen regulatory IIA component